MCVVEMIGYVCRRNYWLCVSLDVFAIYVVGMIEYVCRTNDWACVSLNRLTQYY